MEDPALRCRAVGLCETPPDLNGLDGALVQQHHPLLAALTLHDHRPAARRDRAGRQVHRLGHPHARRVEDLEQRSPACIARLPVETDGLVPCQPMRRLQKPVHLGDRKHQGEAGRPLHGRGEAGRIGLGKSLPDKEAMDRSDDRPAVRDGRLGEVSVVEMAQVCAEIVAGGIQDRPGPRREEVGPAARAGAVDAQRALGGPAFRGQGLEPEFDRIVGRLLLHARSLRRSG